MEVLVIVLLVGLFVLFIFIYKSISEIKGRNNDKVILEWLKTTQSSLSSNSLQMVTTLQENSRQLNERLDKAAMVMRDVGKEVGQMNEIGRSMKELQEFLKSPKLRGNIGEQVLKDLISQVFPKNSFHLQYEFKSGDRVDAAIRTDAGILPIDSKFPMENFQRFVKAEGDEEKVGFRREFGRDVKRHIDAIAKKYILPDEGTMDFALLYVPSEAVFYEIVNMDELLNYARDRRVYIVSPSTLYAHLQTILLSFEGKKIAEESKEVFRMLRALKLDFEKVQASMDVLGKHIGNSSSQYSNVQKGFSGIGNKLDSVKHLE